MPTQAFIPEELLIIGASFTLHKEKVSAEEVKKFIVNCPIPIQYEEESVDWKYCTYNEEDNTFTITKMPQLTIEVVRLFMYINSL